jgi:COMPASS component SWD3
MWTKTAEVPIDSETRGFITSVRFSPNSSLIALATSNGTLSLHSPDLTQLRSCQRHRKSINEIKWSTDSALILTCSDDGTLYLSRASDFAIVSHFKGHHSYVFTCDISPNRLRVVSGSYDESVRVWNTATGKCLRMISAHAETVTSVSFSNDNLFILSSSWDGYCRIWWAHSGICVKSFELMGIPICFAALSPNNQFVMASCTDSAIRLVNVAERQWAAVFKGHVNQGYSLMAGFSKRGGEGQEVYTASEDGCVVGFDLESQAEIWRVQICEGPTLCGHVCAEGTMLVAGASGETTKTLQLWTREL